MTHSPTHRRFQPLRALLRRSRLVRDRRGAVAVEFAILALPFFGLIAAVLEASIVFFASQVLDSSLEDAMRLIRTGQAQTASYTADTFRTKICDRAFGLFSCNQIKVRVRVLTDFASASVASSVIDPDTGDWLVVEQYNAGAGNSIVIAEAYYKWPTVVNILGFSLANSADGKRLLGTVRVWRNEPF